MTTGTIGEVTIRGTADPAEIAAVLALLGRNGGSAPVSWRERRRTALGVSPRWSTRGPA